MTLRDDVLATPWTRQGEWGGTTLSRSLTYAGMQKALPEWTGVMEGYEAFLHCGETTFIATGQYERFARAMLLRLERERSPLRAFTARFDELLDEIRAFLPTLREPRDHDEKIARYVQLHQQLQPYGYVFGYGEDQVVGELLDRLLREAEDDPKLRQRTKRAALAPQDDADASALLRRLRAEGVDARVLDYAELVRRQLQVRTDRRILWNKVEDAIRPHLARRGESRSLPLRLVLEATPLELLRGLPPRSVLEARIGATFFARRGEVHLLVGEDHEAIQRSLAQGRRAPATELVGQSAYPGLVRGRARIVTSPEQGDAFVKGEILVSDMTTPDLTLACGKAAAIVTDRGGILCHAALVAREMRIPCVLGTQDATRLLRDGDLVEVDAHQGVVRRIHEDARASPNVSPQGNILEEP